MTTTNTNPQRLLAIDPTSRGFGFIVLESPTTLVDWGVKVIRQQDEDKTLTKIRNLIRHYMPETVVFEDCRGSRRCARIQRLLAAVKHLGTTEGITGRCVAGSQVKKVFRTFRATTKHEIAHAVAQQLPDLAPRLPRHRKAWMTEDYQMAIFDAAALALTYFHSRVFRSRGMCKESAAKSGSAAANAV